MKFPELERLDRQIAIIELQRRNPRNFPVRECVAVRVKEWNQPSKLLSLCLECVKAIEPPTKRRFEGDSAVRRCDWCEVKNQN